MIQNLFVSYAVFKFRWFVTLQRFDLVLYMYVLYVVIIYEMHNLSKYNNKFLLQDVNHSSSFPPQLVRVFADDDTMLGSHIDKFGYGM